MEFVQRVPPNTSSKESLVRWLCDVRSSQQSVCKAALQRSYGALTGVRTKSALAASSARLDRLGYQNGLLNHRGSILIFLRKSAGA
jgi:hypothetical protein